MNSSLNWKDITWLILPEELRRKHSFYNSVAIIIQLVHVSQSSSYNIHLHIFPLVHKVGPLSTLPPRDLQKDPVYIVSACYTASVETTLLKYS